MGTLDEKPERTSAKYSIYPYQSLPQKENIQNSKHTIMVNAVLAVERFLPRKALQVVASNISINSIFRNTNTGV